MVGRDELEREKIKAETEHLREKTAWERERAYAQTREIEKPFYLRPTFFAAVASTTMTVGGLLFTWGSGWFDTQNDKLAAEKSGLGAEKKLLELELRELTAERRDFAETQVAFDASVAEFGVRSAELQASWKKLADEQSQLSQARLRHEADLEAVEKERAGVTRDLKSLADEQTRLVEAQQELEARRTDLEAAIEEEIKRVPLQLALTTILTDPWPFTRLKDADMRLREALKVSGELRGEFLEKMQVAATTQGLSQAQQFLLDKALFEETGDFEPCERVVARLKEEAITQLGAYSLISNGLGSASPWGAENHDRILAAALTRAAEAPEEIDWYGTSHLMVNAAGRFVDILGKDVALDLVDVCFRWLRTGEAGDEMAAENVLEGLAAAGLHPLFAGLATLVTERSLSVPMRHMLERTLLELPNVMQRPSSLDRDEWVAWLQDADPAMTVWLEEGLSTLRGSGAEEVIALLGGWHMGESPHVLIRGMISTSVEVDGGPVTAEGVDAAPSFQFRFEVGRRGDYVVETFGSRDVVLTLYADADASNTQIASDDDGGNDLNARLLLELEAGTYFAVVHRSGGSPLDAAGFQVGVRSAE